MSRLRCAVAQALRSGGSGRHAAPTELRRDGLSSAAVEAFVAPRKLPNDAPLLIVHAYCAMLRPPTALDVDPSSETLSPATTVADDGTITAVGGLLIVSIVLAAVCTPRSSVTVSV